MKSHVNSSADDPLQPVIQSHKSSAPRSNNGQALVKSSSYVAYYAYKLFALMFLFMGLAGIHGLLFPEYSLFDPPPEGLSTAHIAFSLAVFAVCFPLAKFMFFRIRVIRYDDNNVEINDGDESRSIKWGDVQSVSKVLMVAPPLYRMKFRDNSEPAYFVMSMFAYAYAMFWSWDFTGFYKFAQERIAKSNDGQRDSRKGR